ncbi:hypothetical protein Pmi06nite_15440 [Planotetraspora mira]|uniref:Uncharacterized protein n=1 Tax=Planotetraspora mira TaxID=58121 RepID=A0A8J3X4V4_9ACTN|nr:hypothetical protein Pmi06nite_15440 [Planotetraspora mira]
MPAPDPAAGRELMVKLIESLSAGVPRPLVEIAKLGRTLSKLPPGEVLGRIGVGCPTRDSDAQTQPEARSCVTVRSGLLRVPAQIGQRRTR